MFSSKRLGRTLLHCCCTSINRWTKATKSGWDPLVRSVRKKGFHCKLRTLVRLQSKGARISFASMGPLSKVFVASHNPRKESRNLRATIGRRCFNTSNLGYPGKMSKSLRSCNKAFGSTFEALVGGMGRRSKAATMQNVRPNNVLELFNQVPEIASHRASTLMCATTIIRASSQVGEFPPY